MRRAGAPAGHGGGQAPARRARGRGAGAVNLQPLNGGGGESGALTDELKVLTRNVEMTPERADELLEELDISMPFYYTRKKRRDPFEDLE